MWGKSDMDDRFEIFYIRHAEPESGLCEGRDSCDIRLSQRGEHQAALLGERFKNAHFDAVFSSPLVRCLGTANGAFSTAEEKPVLQIMPELIEVGSTPGYRGISPEEAREFYPVTALCNAGIYPGVIPNSTDEENDGRARRVFAYFRENFTFGQKIAVFCHGSFGNHFLWAAINTKPTDGIVFSLNHASVTKIKLTPDGTTRISFLNDVSHLRGDMPDFDFTV